MEEENTNANPETILGKFKSVDALAHAYGELEAEFTRRSQRLKALEEQLAAQPAEACAPCGDELYRAVTADEAVRARIVGDYLESLKGAPLMTGGGAGVAAPPPKPASIGEAGKLALAYLRNRK